MKNIIKIISLILLVIVGIASCKTKEDLGTPPGQVTELDASKAPGIIVLKWKNPTDEFFSFVKIEYTINGVEMLKTVSQFVEADAEGFVSVEIDGFPNSDAYEFKVYACNNNGASSDPVIKSFNPDSPIFDVVVNTVEVENAINGAYITWTNQYEREVTIFAQYYKKGSDPSTAKDMQVISSAIEGKMYAEDMEPKVEYVLNVYVRDRYSNSSQPKIFDVLPMKGKLIKLDSSTWTFPGYKANSNSATIGYSSQATNEGGTKDGKITAILDGKSESFWHTSYSNPDLDYPHWFIIDLKEPTSFTQYSIMGREDEGNRKKTQKGQRIYVCTEENADISGAESTWKPEDWLWNNIQYNDFNNESADEQKYLISIEKPIRFIKVYFGEEDGAKGEGKYAAVAEFALYNMVPDED
ncbi:DUF4959 domain-containing protein [Paludibacter sp. 221]|uniref:DUF4959 domain-containing protein n=1 Tax=Paludibacter sp. 221 TaxID=2302939 RepID=UPI0013D6DE30|nr:DUF4959 domain-containing protein [Paludibacter sp. 221]NDV47393.1 DUF4959 domain-containing protein [Paludibacter sp. 221]